MEELALDVRTARPHAPRHQANQLHLWRVGPAPHRHQGDLHAVRPPQDRARRLLLDWIGQQQKLSLDERYYDAAAVLSGTMLMASSISGAGPESHDSSVNLISLLPKVARQRDAYYERLMTEAKGPRRTRLRREAKGDAELFGPTAST